MRITPRIARFAMNIFPPFMGAGIKVSFIRDDWQELHVEMPLRWYNKNAVRTHFGGSLYAMTDPQLMLMLMQLLGKEYIIWDKAACIEFVKPGTGKVKAIFTITDEQLSVIRDNIADGSKYLPEFDVKIVDENGEVVANVKKTLYIRKKKSD